MGVSTYCQFGSTESHAHCRNAEIPCDCACHTQDQGAPMTTLAEHRVLEGAPDANGTTAPKQKGKRRRWSDDEKRRIALEYSEAPKGAGHAVIAKYELSSSMVIKWCRDLGLTARKRQSRAGRAAPPGPPAPAPKATVADTDEADELELIEQQRVGIILEGDEIDVFGALAFLEGIGPDELAARLVTELIENSRADPDVNLCVTAKRARTAEAG